MLRARNRALFNIWRRQVFVRNRHPDLDDLIAKFGLTSGIYLIGCAGEVVYVGQSWHLHDRAIESLGRAYFKVADSSLPWSMALAPCSPEEMDERESSAIRSYAPKFNTSIPSVKKSEGRMPEVAGVAAIFQDQSSPCGAFAPMNLDQQSERAAANPNPPWKTKKKRRKSPERPSLPVDPLPSQVEWSKISPEVLLKTYGVSLNEPLRFKVNLCEDGSVITKDGEYIGTWSMDENEHAAFVPDGATEILLFSPWVGLLCQEIREWYEAKTGEVISD